MGDRRIIPGAASIHYPFRAALSEFRKARSRGRTRYGSLATMVLCASSITETVAAVSKIYCPHEMKLPGRYRGLSTTPEVVERGVRPIVTLRHATSVSVHAGTFPNLMLMQTCVDGAGTIRQGDVKASDAYNAACLAGLGLIQAPELGVREHLARGVLVEMLPRYRPEPMSLSLLYAHRRNLPKRVRVFHGLGR
jgi:hypothetical protein